MSLLPPLPIPAEGWLRSVNERYRGQDISPSERPFRAMEDWAAHNAQPANFGVLALSHLGGPAWTTIDSFFRAHTELGHERTQSLGRSVWFYDGSFYPINLIVIFGGAGPVGEINPFQCFAKNMPTSLLHDFSRDEPKVQEYLEHLSNALDSFTCSSGITQELKAPVARNFLSDAATQLDSAINGLLDTYPNSQAAGHARLAFETSLKALLAEKAGLTRKGAVKIRHHLDQLFDAIVAGCVHLIPAVDLGRIKNAAIDSVSSRRLFPEHDAHYDSVTLPGRRLWECYATAQHSFATVVRALGGSDSRELQKTKGLEGGA